jgi:hypothetical protein
LTALAAAACGSSAATATGGAAPSTFRVSGTVARVCPGPIIVGARQRCYDRAVFKLGNKRWTVQGRFAIRLPRGSYAITVDNCASPQRLKISRAVSGLRLIPRCPEPL